MQLLVDLFSSLVSLALQHSVTNLDTQSKGKGEIHMNSNYVLNLTWQALKRSTTQFVKPQMCLFRDVDFVSNGFVFHFMWLACYLLRMGIDTPHHQGAKHYKSQN